MSRERPFADLVAIGRVVKPQGRRGEVVVEPFTDRPDRFPGLRCAYVEAPGGAAEVIQVDGCWPHKGRFVLKLRGVDSIDQAAGYRGREIRIGEEELEPLPEGSYYHHQLRGLSVESPAGRPLGRVTGLLETGAGVAVLVVQGDSGERLVPLAEDFVREVDLAGGRLVVELRESVDAGR